MDSQGTSVGNVLIMVGGQRGGSSATGARRRATGQRTALLEVKVKVAVLLEALIEAPLKDLQEMSNY